MTCTACTDPRAGLSAGSQFYPCLQGSLKWSKFALLTHEVLATHVPSFLSRSMIKLDFLNRLRISRRNKQHSHHRILSLLASGAAVGHRWGSFPDGHKERLFGLGSEYTLSEKE